VFRSPADHGVVFGTMLLLGPIAVVGVAGAAVRQFNLPSLVVLGLVVGTLIWMAVLATRTAAFVRCSPEQITVGLAPFWRTRLARRDVVEVAIVRIDAHADYGGWGIKGAVRSARGRLYSVGGEAAVRLEMRDGRTFVVAFKDPRAAESVRRVLCDQD
jgi:hypothetical protein